MDAGELQLALLPLLGAEAGGVAVTAGGEDLDERGTGLVEGVPRACVVVFALLIPFFALALSLCAGTFILLSVLPAVFLVRRSVTAEVELVIAGRTIVLLLGCG